MALVRAQVKARDYASAEVDENDDAHHEVHVCAYALCLCLCPFPVPVPGQASDSTHASEGAAEGTAKKTAHAQA